MAEAAVDLAGEALARPRLMGVNAALFLTVLVALVSGILPAACIFMTGLSVALTINDPGVDTQMQRIGAHAANALTMGAIILAAGSFAGILAPASIWDGTSAPPFSSCG